MYHDIRYEVYGKQKWFCVTPQQIQKDMELVSRNFSTISLHELKSWANKEASLPENPIIITFDDGYYSFYEHAFPVLERLGMKATVSLVGSQIGKKCYKDSDIHLIKRIGYEEARSMFSSGLVDFQSHSYDMHDNKDVEADGRTGSLIKEGESRRSTYLYLAALTISFLDTLFPTFLSLSIGLTFSWFRPDRNSREPSVDAWS